MGDIAYKGAIFENFGAIIENIGAIIENIGAIMENIDFLLILHAINVIQFRSISDISWSHMQTSL